MHQTLCFRPGHPAKHVSPPTRVNPRSGNTPHPLDTPIPRNRDQGPSSLGSRERDPSPGNLHQIATVAAAMLAGGAPGAAAAAEAQREAEARAAAVAAIRTMPERPLELLHRLVELMRVGWAEAGSRMA